MQDLKGRLADRVQLTTDGFKPYLNAVEDAFGLDIDYAQLVKLYGQPKASAQSLIGTSLSASWQQSRWPLWEVQSPL